MNLKKKKSKLQLGLQPEAKCSMWTGQKRTVPRPEDAIHITDIGGSSIQLSSKWQEGVLMNKINIVILQQVSVRWEVR